jgi:hypothetical protein
MNEFYFYYFQDNKAKSLVIYSTKKNPDSSRISSLLRDYCDRIIIPDRIIIIIPKPFEETYEALIQDERFQSYLPLVTRVKNTPEVQILSFDENGESNKSELDDLKLYGLINIFKSRDGIIESSSTHHYIKPSGRHSNKFIRAGNVLVSGSEINFIAFCVLPYLKNKSYKKIYCDTGAIISVAYAITHLQSLFYEETKSIPVSSFGSYMGLKENTLVDVEESIFLISATTSRGLEEEIQRKYPSLPSGNLISLFSLGVNDNGNPIVCKLDKTDSLKKGYEPIESWSQDICPECQNFSTPIEIVGDQFIPEGVELDPILITVNDAPKWLENFCSKVVGHNFIRIFYAEGDSSEGVFHRELYFDIAAFLKNIVISNPEDFQEYKDRFDFLFDTLITASLKQIIYLDDPASQEFARIIKARCIKENLLKNDIALINVNELQGFINNGSELTGSSLIVCSASASGRSLISTSQYLRVVQENGSYSYFICLVKTKDSKSYNELKSNLAFGEKPNDRYVNFIEKIELPLQGRSESTPWKLELDFLRKIIPSGSELDDQNPIVRRINVINEGDEGIGLGLINHLFWKSLKNKKLTLSTGFAFFNKFEYVNEDISQADIYFTIKSILHNLRESPLKRKNLQQQTHRRSVISPRNFDRFNDGIIQAAILRAAKHGELDYSADQSLSDEMLKFLEFMYKNRKNDTGDAFPEFLLAISMGKLKLTQKDLRSFYNKQLKDIEFDGLHNALADVIKDEILISEEIV